jgi:hypothetical protein
MLKAQQKFTKHTHTHTHTHIQTHVKHYNMKLLTDLFVIFIWKLFEIMIGSSENETQNFFPHSIKMCGGPEV